MIVYDAASRPAGRPSRDLLFTSSEPAPISHVRFPSQVLAQGPSAADDDVYGGLIEVEGAHTWKRCSDDQITNIVLRTSGAIVPPTV